MGGIRPTYQEAELYKKVDSSALFEKWTKIRASVLSILVDSMSSRCAAVIPPKRYATKY